MRIVHLDGSVEIELLVDPDFCLEVTDTGVLVVYNTTNHVQHCFAPGNWLYVLTAG